VAPAARQGGTADAPSGEVRLARGLNAPSGRVCLAREPNAPSGEVRLVRGIYAPSGQVRLARGLNAPSGLVEPSNTFSMTTQGYVVTSGQRERSSPSLSALCGHPRHCSATLGTMTTSPMLLECTGTGHHHDRHCAVYGPPVDGTLKPAHGRRPDNQPLRHHPRSCSCTSTGRATTLRLEHDSPGWPSAPWHCSPRLHTYEIVWHTCKLLPP
jgi:hypothetical protein